MKNATLPPEAQAEVWTGVADAAAPAIAEHAFMTGSANVGIIFLAEPRLLDDWCGALDFYGNIHADGSKPEILPLPEHAEHPEEDPRAFDLECDRLAALARLNDFREGRADENEWLLLVTTPRAFFAPAPKRENLSTKEIRLKAGDSTDLLKLAGRLATDLSYASEAVCERPGEFAVRGGILDVYPVNAERPFRIDFFGDEIETIRAYDPTTQRSEDAVNAISITTLTAATGELREHHIFDYLPDRVLWVFREPTTLAERHKSLFTFPERMASALPTMQDLVTHREPFPDEWLALAELDVADTFFAGTPQRVPLETEPLENYRTFVAGDALGADRTAAEQDARKAFLGHLLDWQKNGYAIFLAANNDAERERFREILDEDKDLAALRTVNLIGKPGNGFRMRFAEDGNHPQWPGTEGKGGVVLVTDAEIFGRYRMHAVARRRKLPNRKQVDQLLDFHELVEGDHLVHLQHGVCIYRGITEMDIAGRNTEVVSLEFDDSITLHLPLHESHLLTRYVGLAKSKPKLGRPGTNRWDKARRAAEKSTLDLAAELLRMQAARDTRPGRAAQPDTHWQREFEESFIYTETPDQLRAINEAKADMETERPMDRLVCGDVGFGKTEVALRAAFKMVMEGRQVSVLAPTTILAQQHFNTFRERMADYPVVVEMISRFRSPSQQKVILAQLKTGAIDIVIGTHRLLSTDVDFKDLGLLVIDEEHRFGVKQKELVKHMRTEIDVISMSATPIPRTLYLALMGARDLSIIETPPVDRLPIQTIVKSYDRDLVKRAIRQETDRGGQVFYLHNRVKSIHSVALKLMEDLPDLKVAIGHGQMDEDELEEVMTRFVAGDYDVLVCTTIIENGLDIPNCNTIIIEGADRFGLSQLYQLRGRVGRFKRQAYCYLLLHRQVGVVESARKRLTAMRQHNQLGAGYRIAMRDLELRGAGNLLGAQQSGHIAGVGFDLYCSLLRQSIARLKGDKNASFIRANVRLDFIAVGDGDGDAPVTLTKVGYEALREAEHAGQLIGRIPANIPAAYISETRLRIDFYRRLALAENAAAITAIEEELTDRFGTPPQPVQALLATTHIRTLAEQNRIASVETKGDRLMLARASGKPQDYIKSGSRFPRLTTREPHLRLKEIITFLTTRQDVLG